MPTAAQALFQFGGLGSGSFGHSETNFHPPGAFILDVLVEVQKGSCRGEMLSRLSCVPGLPSLGSKISTKNFRHDLATEQK